MELMGIATECLAVVEAMNYTADTRDEFGVEAGEPIDKDLEQLYGMALALLSKEITDVSRLVWISPEMVDLVTRAAASLPPYVFHPSVLPWPSAIVVCAKPVFSVPDRFGVPHSLVVFQWYTANPSNLALIVNGLSYTRDGLVPSLVTTLRDGSEWGDLRGGHINQLATDEFNIAEIAQFMCAMWLLVQQRVAVTRQARASRADRRRWDRIEAGPIPETTVIELRRPVTQSGEREDPGFVEWSRRWIVDGHWRNQYHPSTGERVPTWIAPYIKDPEDKPLVVQRKINAWVR